ncbi:MAG: AI-2E family transporter [Leptolyngbya sp. SIO1E4]|nr:AI-2E family transporter [Leptolyngbya sp. SIO1E4]
MKFGKLVGFVALLLGLYLLWRIRFIVLLAFLAVALATLLNRIVRQLTRWRLKRGFAIAFTLIAISILVAVILTIAVPPFVEQVRQWLNQMPLEAARISLWIEQLDDRVPFELSEEVQRLDTFIRDIPRLIQGVFSNFFIFFRGTLSFLVNFLLVLALTIMLLAHPRAYRRAFVVLFPEFYRYRVQEILDHCETSLVAWGVGILFNMAVITLMSFVGLAVIGVPLPIANASIAGVLTFIPNVGPVLSVIPPAILGLLEAPWKAIAVIFFYIVIQQIEGNFLTPLIMKRQVSLLPAITLLSQLVFGLLFGFLGLFLALPMVVIGQVWLQELLVRDIMDKWSAKDVIPRH